MDERLRQRRWDAMDRKVMDDILRTGWSDMAIFPTSDQPGLPFNYTVGLSLLAPEHPELFIIGMDNHRMHSVLATMVARIKDGTRFKPNILYHRVVTDYQVGLVPVEDPFGEYPMSMTRHLIGDDFNALQVVWPDTHGRFPWHDDYEERFRPQQPLLGAWHGKED